MASRKSGYEYLKERQRGARATERLATKRLIWVHRPIWLHERRPKDTPGRCECCDSPNAIRVEILPHLDVIFDRQTGARVVRSAANATEFDELAKHAERVDCPVRCYAKQLAIITDRTHKHIGVFGGSRAGKSTAEAEWFFDQILERGGAGATFWWIGPDAKQARSIGLGKLVKGERTDRFAAPIIPAQLIVAWPRNAQQDIPLRLIDGSEVWFKHGSETDAANLKGAACQAIVLDEGCACRHEVTWDEAVSRLTDAGGQILTASTPVLGNFLEHRVFKVGKTYEEIAAGAQTDTAVANITVFDNPWQSEADTKAFSDSFGTDDLRRKLQVYGEWVVVGVLLWRNWTKDHIVEGVERDVVAYYGLANITHQVAAAFFRKTTAHLQFIGGQDFNTAQPMNCAILQVGCHPGLDAKDPQNWVLFAADLVARDCDVIRWADWLRDQAGGRRERGLAPDHYRGMAIAADASQGHANHGPTHGVDPFIQTMNRAGFDCRPCNLTINGHAQNPPVPARVTLMHRLMADRVTLPGGAKIPRLLAHGTNAYELIHALERQTATPDGRPYKLPNTKSDRISGPIDAASYGAWALLSDIDRPKSRVLSNSLFS